MAWMFATITTVTPRMTTNMARLRNYSERSKEQWLRPSFMYSHVMPQIEAAEKAATGQKYKEVKNSTMADWEENEQLSPYVIFFMS